MRKNKKLKFNLKKFSAIIICASLLWLNFGAREVSAATNSFPRTANYFLWTDINETQMRNLSRYDVVVLDMEIQIKHPELLKRLRVLNPNITILAYITSEEIKSNSASGSEPMRKKLASGIAPDWYLNKSNGSPLQFWPGTSMLNVTNLAPAAGGQRWNTYLPQFVANNILSSGLWDGVFYDNGWDSISWFSGADVDFNRDGVADPNVDQTWREGMETLYNETKRLVGNKYLVVTNVNGNAYLGLVNGVMVENFPSKGWPASMKLYADSVQQSSLWPAPRLSIINSNTKNKGAEQSYQAMRYGLTSALLSDGYYSFDYGDTNHAQTWWYDEYNVKLGSASSGATSVSGQTNFAAGSAWRRDFNGGIALVNPTNQTVTVDLGGEYEKIIGTQDKVVNNGEVVTSVDVPPQDGLVMLKTFQTIKNAFFANGAFARFFTASGARSRNGFFVFEDNVPGGARIYNGDIDGNGQDEKIVVSGNKMQIYDSQGQTWYNGFPLGANYPGTLSVSLGKLNAETSATIAISGSRGGKVVLFNYYGAIVKEEIYPLGKKYTQGFSVTLGPTGSGGTSELVLATGKGRSTEILFYNLKQDKIIRRFSPYGKFSAGAFVAVGNFSDTGLASVATLALVNGQPNIRVFDAQGKKTAEFKLSRIISNLLGLSTLNGNSGGRDEIVVYSNN